MEDTRSRVEKKWGPIVQKLFGDTYEEKHFKFICEYAEFYWVSYDPVAIEALGGTNLNILEGLESWDIPDPLPIIVEALSKTNMHNFSYSFRANTPVTSIVIDHGDTSELSKLSRYDLIGHLIKETLIEQFNKICVDMPLGGRVYLGNLCILKQYENKIEILIRFKIESF